MSRPVGIDAQLLSSLRLALQQAVEAPDLPGGTLADGADEDGEASLSPRAATANALEALAMHMRAACFQMDDLQGKEICDLLADICFYVVDPAVRLDMLDLAAHCVAVLEGARAIGSWDGIPTDGLRERFNALKPSDDDADAIARALGMSAEDAAAFGLTGHITPIGLDEDEDELAFAGIDAAAPERVETESLEDLFRRDALHLVSTTMPQALQRYWKNQSNMDALLDVRRAFHTLKGDAAVAAQSTEAESSDLPGLSILAEAAEDIIDELLGDERDSRSAVPALPGGAFGLLGEAQTYLLKRLEARAALPDEPSLLSRLQAMQAKSRALADGDAEPAIALPSASSDTLPRIRERTARPARDQESAHRRLLSTFLSEADKLMPDLHRALARLSADPGDESALVRARAKLHTLKGGAALVGAEVVPVERLAHGCEDILELIEDYQLRGSLSAVPPEVLSGVLDAEDALQALLDDLHARVMPQPRGAALSPHTPVSKPNVDALLVQLATLKARVESDSVIDPASVPEEQVSVHAPDRAPAQIKPVEESIAPASPAGPTPHEDVIAELAPLPRLTVLPPQRVPTRSARRVTAPAPQQDGPLAALRALEDQQVSRDAVEQLIASMAAQALEARRSSARLRDLIERVEQELAGLRFELLRTSRRSGDWDALEKEEYTAIDVLLMQLDEALADQYEAETRLRRDIAEARAQNEVQAAALLRAQRSLLNISMVPLSSLEARFDHAVRSVARRVNKNVIFEMEGGEIALDSRIADSLFNPFMLLINNAVDHGLEEKPAERVAAGKPAEGRIVVRGATNGDSVTIAISDDGQGIDPDRVAAVAVSKGVADPSRAATMTREERLALIWSPGFSTARQVSAISGRGMGLKSVRDDIAALQGHVAVETETGKGTTFTITLPRSLAMMRVQVVREGSHLAAVPISNIELTHAVPYNAIVEVPNGRAVRVGRRTISVYPAHLTAGPSGDGANGLGILLQATGREGGILVDEVLYSQYLPVRPAPAYLRRSCGLIGYALGAGGIILPILDLSTLIDKAAPAMPLMAQPRASDSARHTILIVDDSQTMRRALSQTFGKAGFSVHEAANGREALTAISRAMPDLITLDMEMPGMDGLETLAALRMLPQGATVPVFMITSRQQARHRAAALSAGVTRYFTKPYDENELMGAARLALAATPAEQVAS